MSFRHKVQGGRVFLMCENGVWFDESLLKMFYPEVTEISIVN